MDATKTAAQQAPTVAPAPAQQSVPEHPVMARGAGTAVGPVAAMQSLVGNRAVGAILAAGERPLIQRKCADCESSGSTCSGCEDEEMVQRAPLPGAKDGAAGAGIPAPVLQAFSEGGGRRMEPATREFMESRFGRGFGGVRLHTGASASRAADSVDAQAFTVGSDIWFGRGFYRPAEPGGLHLLAHELAHTVQQGGQPVGAQARLRLGGLTDSPEGLADRAADAVMANAPVPRIGSAGIGIHRKPKVSPVANNPKQRIVEMDDGKKYRVTQRIDWKQVPRRVSDDPLKFDAKITKDRVWLQVDYCKEKDQVAVQVGANVPAAAAATLKDMILKGTPPKEALLNAEVEPFISVEVAKSKKYEVSVEPTIKVVPGKGEVTGGGIKGRLKLPGGWEGTLEGSINKPPEGQTRPEGKVQIGVEKKFGGGPKKVECPTVIRQEWEPTIDYTCEEFVPAHEVEKTRTVTRRKSVYLYFKYAKAELEGRAKEPGGKLNPASQADLKASLADRWKVTEITGHASPEGPVDPAKRFQGNKALSDDRATAAAKWVEDACPPPSLLTMRSEDASCFAPGFTGAGKGELYGGAETPELKGKPLAKQAVGEFETSEAESRHRTPEVEKEIEKRKASPERQADVVYPLLRRAEVHLARPEKEKYKVPVPEGWEPLGTCPTEARRAAADDFAKAPAPQPPAAKK